MVLMHETVTKKVFCVCSDPCLYYHKVYGWFQKGELSEETWNMFCMACLENLREKNKKVLDQLKNM